MSMLRRGIALAVTAGSLLLTSGTQTATRVVGPREGGDNSSPSTLYTKSEKEFYLTQEQLAGIQPGYHIKINTVTIPADRKPVVEVTITDDLGLPLDRLGLQTPGTCGTTFVLAWYNGSTRDYTSYATRVQTSPINGKSATQATSDSGGVYKDLELGHFTYTFKTVLPSNFDRTRTHTIAAYGRRTMPDYIPVLGGKEYIDNDEFDFRPDGGTVTEKWDEIQEKNACNQCHSPLAAHGDVRTDAKLCVLCHSPQTSDPDTGNTVDMRVMIHKIHRGEHLHNKPYIIIGNSQSVHDFSTVAFPQDIRNCQNCHEGRDPANKPSQSHVWYTFPARAPCGACHDDIDWVTGAGHAAGPQADDSQCAKCHLPEGSQEWDIGVRTAHTVPYKSKQLKGLNVKILSVTNVGAGKKPTMTFQITENDGKILAPNAIGASPSINVLLGGPTTDYAINPFRENIINASFNGSIATYNFTNAIPSNAKGTWAVAIEARRTITFNPPPPEGPSYTEGAVNPIFYIAVTDGTAVPRRNVVVLDNCNKCHDRLATTFSHGGQRIAIEECVICHNPIASDVGRRPADQAPPESISLKRMIHRIHKGEELTQDFSVYGFSGASNFNEVLYPGDLKNCVQCHTSTSTYNLPLPNGAIPVQTPRDYFSPQGPGTSACLGCHDNVDAAAHAYLNTVFTPFFAEACATCHGDGKDWDVVKVHAK